MTLNINGLKILQSKDTFKIVYIMTPLYHYLHTPKELISSSSDTHPALFTAALVTVARKWKHCKHPSTNEWLMKMCYIYTMEYYSVVKKNEIVNSTDEWLEKPLPPTPQMCVHNLE